MEDRRWKTGDRRQEMGDRRWETREERQEMGDRRLETGDGRLEIGDRRWETGDVRPVLPSWSRYFFNHQKQPKWRVLWSITFLFCFQKYNQKNSCACTYCI